MDSPPKRMTRARAAAKASEPAVKPTKIVTAAARAKSSSSTPAAGSTRTAAKRKARADETDDEDDFAQEQPVTTTRKATRGRPRKTAEPAQSSTTTRGTKATTTTRATKPTRGRPAKKLATEASKAAAVAAAPASGPARATRGRPKKVVEPEPEPEEPAPEPPKRATRGRGARAAATTTRPAAKKTVKFEDPDKENVAPHETKKEAKKEPAAAPSIRGRPARRGGATAARSTRKTATTAATKNTEKKPLSPKKVTQLSTLRCDDSEDELAALDYSPIRALKKSPVKPPASVRPQAKTPEPALDEQDDDATLTVNDAILNPPALGSTTLASPARRAPSSAMKETMRSPARKIGPVPFPASVMKSASKPAGLSEHGPTSQNSLLLSAAKRPPSPIKGLTFVSPSKYQKTPSSFKSSMLQSPAKRAMPGLKPLAESPRREEASKMAGSPPMKPLTMSTPSQDAEMTPSERLLMEHESSEGEDDHGDEDIFQEPISKIKFPGRLSAVLPRDVDPDPSPDNVETGVDGEQDVEFVQVAPEVANVDDAAEVPAEQTQAQEVDLEPQAEESQPAPEPVGVTEDDHVPMEADEVAKEIVVALSPRSSPQESSPRPQNLNFQLREKDLDPYGDLDMESDTSLLSPSKEASGTPAASLFQMCSRRSSTGFTLLAEQFGSWSAGSPTKGSTPELTPKETETGHGSLAATEQPAAASHFFDDEMQSRPETTARNTTSPTVKSALEDNELVCTGIPLQHEDFDLAQEADEMSVMGGQRANGDPIGQSHDDSLSDASQEYGDENQVPIDPSMLGTPAAGPVTPVRPQRHVFPHTTTKIPLKPADESTPSPSKKKRCFSASRVPPPRSTGGVSRSGINPDLSPSKSRRASSSSRNVSALPPTTPNKSSDSSSVYTPGTRDDLNPNLLRGAVVFVDVHTTEGADASGIFMELLTQMGARCRKTWDWNPSSPCNADASSNKAGITHIVYKDGGKRTLEKVRQTNGLVHCVGVSWVLDCERENEWLDEAPYYIDTTLIPRGGGRRRKSMEPKALTNMNGTLVDSNSKSRRSQGAQTPNTSYNRRQSAVWMHTPSDQGDGNQDDDIEWSQFILTPVPKTPAPEAIAKYAAEIPETPSADDDDSCSSPTKESLMMRTCPPKARDGVPTILDIPDRDDQLMRRLMAARRKSLQFAPKIASPLSKTWQ